MTQENTNSANIELNQKLEGSPYKKSKIKNTEEANMELQNALQGDHDPEEITPTYLYNNTPGIRVSKNDVRD